MAKLKFSNMGPIREIELDEKQFNVFIGEQATGKSTIAKGIYFFKKIKSVARDFLFQVSENGEYNQKSIENITFYKATQRETKELFINLFGYTKDLDPNLEMRYEYAKDVHITITLSKDSSQFLNMSYSNALTKKMKELTNEALHFHEKDLSFNTQQAKQEGRNRNRKDIEAQINQLFDDYVETYYIPAGRSVLTLFSSNRATMNNLKNLDLITEEFMVLIDGIRSSFSSGYESVRARYGKDYNNFTSKEIDVLFDWIKTMQKGEYYSSNGVEKIRIDKNKQEIGINYASSGQQEILWLLNFLLVLLLSQERAFLIIEEPEAHIYPILQKKLIEFIVFTVNKCQSKVLITTHSPYVLTVTNNLYYAGVLSDTVGEKIIGRIIRKECQIKRNEINVIKMLDSEEGSVKKDLLNEDGEIDSFEIDDVSQSVNEEYTKLYGALLDLMEDKNEKG